MIGLAWITSMDFFNLELAFRKIRPCEVFFQVLLKLLNHSPSDGSISLQDLFVILIASALRATEA